MEKTGCCVTIIGPMYAGKTTTLINISRDCKKKGQLVLGFKPKKDDRYGLDSNFHSHDGDVESCILIENTDEILIDANYNDANVIIIEEAHFFDENIVTNIERMIDDGKYIICSGLSGSYKRRTIGSIANIIALSSTITQLYAKCELCTETTLAPFTSKISGEHGTDIEVGGKNTYIPVCEKHFNQYD